jgi:SAM-dependent methyltransferase
MPRVQCFEKNLDQYEKWFEQNNFAYQSELKAVKNLIPKDGFGLEVGVGTGRFAVPLGIKIGVEPSHTMGDLAMYRGVDVYQSYGESLPFPDTSFSYVLFVMTICFLNDLQTAMSEVYRVLKPGGHIIIGFINRKNRLGKRYITTKRSNVFYREARFYSTDDVRFILEKSGFSNFAYSQTIFQYPEMMKKPDQVMPGFNNGAFVVIRGEKSTIQSLINW